MTDETRKGGPVESQRPRKTSSACQYECHFRRSLDTSTYCGFSSAAARNQTFPSQSNGSADMVYNNMGTRDVALIGLTPI
jgi:hypothetical protein